MTFPTILLTREGVRGILKALKGDEIEFSKIKLGDGVAPADIRKMTDIVSPKYTCGITGITIDDGFATLDFSFDNAHVSQGFFARELGVYMTDENGNDVLYGYTNAGNECGYVKPFNQETYVHTNFHVTVAIGDAENVTAVIAPDIGYVSDAEFNEHLTEFNTLKSGVENHLAASNPHNITKETIGLSNVVNSAPSDMQIVFQDAANLDQIPSGSTLSTIAGKVNKILENISGSSMADPSDMQITYTEPTTLTKPASGSKLSVITGALAKAIDTLLSHIGRTDNPHTVTYSQVGAAAASHTHVYADLSGVAPASHTHNFADISGAANVNHTHTMSNIVDLEIATVAETKSYLGIEV